MGSGCIPRLASAWFLCEHPPPQHCWAEGCLPPWKEPGGASPGFCWLDSPLWWPPRSPWPPHEHRSGLQGERRDAQRVLTGFLRSCKLPRYQPRQGCDRRKCSYVQERGCGLQDTRIGEEKMIKHPNTLQIHSSCRLHRTSDDSIVIWILQYFCFSLVHLFWTSSSKSHCCL